MCLLAGLDDNIVTTKKGKVKDRSWGGAKKQMLGNIKGFVETLKTFKDISDAGNVPDINWKEVRPYLLLEHFNYETIKGEYSTCLVCKYKQGPTRTNVVLYPCCIKVVHVSAFVQLSIIWYQRGTYVCKRHLCQPVLSHLSHLCRPIPNKNNPTFCSAVSFFFFFQVKIPRRPVYAIGW